jgi:hypothetical protein
MPYSPADMQVHKPNKKLQLQAWQNPKGQSTIAHPENLGQYYLDFKDTVKHPG